jgi:hypothetical protein
VFFGYEISALKKIRQRGTGFSVRHCCCCILSVDSCQTGQKDDREDHPDGDTLLLETNNCSKDNLQRELKKLQSYCQPAPTVVNLCLLISYPKNTKHVSELIQKLAVSNRLLTHT